MMSHLQMRVKIEDFNTVGTRLHPHMIVLHLLTFYPGDGQGELPGPGGLDGGGGQGLCNNWLGLVSFASSGGLRHRVIHRQNHSVTGSEINSSGVDLAPDSLMMETLNCLGRCLDSGSLALPCP